jgi:subtilase family serine protease
MVRFAHGGLFRRAAIVMVVALVLVPVVPVAAGATTSPSHIVTRLSGMQPAPLSRSGARLEKVAALESIKTLRIYFASPDTAALKAAAQAIATPSSPDYRHYLTVSQFRALYAPPAATTDVVNGYLTSLGLKVGPVDPNGMSEPVSGTVKELNTALHTTMQQVRTAAGAQVVGATQAPGLPANLASAISYIDGLTPWVQAHDNIAQPPARPAARPLSSGAKPGVTTPGITAAQECSSLSQAAATEPVMDPAELASAYKLSGFYSKSDNGQAETIGLVEYDTYDQPAVAAWAGCLSIPVTVTATTDGTIQASAAPATIEATSDIETLMGLAPSANISVYETANGAGVDLNPWTEAIGGVSGEATPSVISSSWGLCEPETDSSAYSAESTLFAEASMQGQTILVASGDQGSEACFDPTVTSPNKALAVNDPASNPLVTAVGGTSSNTVNGVQYVWNVNDGSSCLGSPNNCAGGASGGGLSSVWDQPSYQPTSTTLQSGCVSGGLTESPVSGTGSTGCREVPDVSAFAGNLYWEACTDEASGPCDLAGGTVGAQYFVPVGGTSLAAPSWAATVALADEQCAANVGFLNYALYDDATSGHSLVGAVTSGNNDFTVTNSGKYGAFVGGSQNLATGVGYLGGVDLSSKALCEPSSPVAVIATPGNDSITANWSAARYSGTSNITGYTATVTPAGTGPTTCTAVSPSPCTFTGLTNGSPYTVSVTATNSSGTGPPAATGWITPAPTVSFPGWTHLPGAATSISEGANGSVWAVGTAGSGNHPVYQWTGNGWKQWAGAAVAVAVGPNGLPWAINSSNQIFQLTAEGWIREPGAATAISVGANGAVWVIGTAGSGNHPIYKWNGSGWIQEPGAAAKIAVGPQGAAWVTTNTGQIYQWAGTGWLLKSGGATAISEGADGAVWVITGNDGVFRYTGTTWSQVSGSAVTVAVGPNGLPWVVNSAHQIFEG